jgi:hypothetical protein
MVAPKTPETMEGFQIMIAVIRILNQYIFQVL